MSPLCQEENSDFSCKKMLFLKGVDGMGERGRICFCEQLRCRRFSGGQDVKKLFPAAELLLNEIFCSPQNTLPSTNYPALNTLLSPTKYSAFNKIPCPQHPVLSHKILCLQQITLPSTPCSLPQNTLLSTNYPALNTLPPSHKIPCFF